MAKPTKTVVKGWVVQWRHPDGTWCPWGWPGRVVISKQDALYHSGGAVAYRTRKLARAVLVADRAAYSASREDYTTTWRIRRATVTLEIA